MFTIGLLSLYSLLPVVTSSWCESTLCSARHVNRSEFSPNQCHSATSAQMRGPASVAMTTRSSLVWAATTAFLLQLLLCSSPGVQVKAAEDYEEAEADYGNNPEEPDIPVRAPLNLLSLELPTLS